MKNDIKGNAWVTWLSWVSELTWISHTSQWKLLLLTPRLPLLASRLLLQAAREESVFPRRRGNTLCPSSISLCLIPMRKVKKHKNHHHELLQKTSQEGTLSCIFIRSTYYIFLPAKAIKRLMKVLRTGPHLVSNVYGTV